MLHIFPEGCTTNGTKLIKFKKGAFASLKAVKPMVLRYEPPSWAMTPVTDTLGFAVLFVCGMCCFNTFSRDVLPNFMPNEFFWANHWDQASGEEKWEAFARVMREIIAHEGGYGLSNCTMEDKFKAKADFKLWKKESKS